MAFDLTPIVLITGLPGSGKTLFTLSELRKFAEREKRQVYYHGIPKLAIDWQLLDDPKDWYKTPKGSIILIDECQSAFSPRSAGSPVPETVSKANTIRHEGRNLVLITQHPMLIDNAIRKLVTKHYHVVRFYGFAKSTIHEFNQVKDNCDKSLKNSIQTHFVYPKEVYNWYKSADMHTIKKRIPARLILIFVLPILLVFAVWFAIHRIGGLDKEAKDSMPKSSDGQLIHPIGREPDKRDYFQENKPRVADIPSSAPKYDEVTKPQIAPIPAACIASKTRCLCYSQQATLLNTTDGFCRQVAANGYFVDWRQNEPLQRVAMRQEKEKEKPDYSGRSVPADIPKFTNN
jgi:hypothetical protein